MAYRLHYSDYPGSSGPPDPAAWVGPAGPQGVPGPVGPQGIPGQPTAGGPFLPSAGGSLSGPLGLWGTSSSINTYDAQVWATGGATVPGNPGQGELNYMAGRHVFQGYDGTTQFRIANIPWSWQWWEASGGSSGTAALLRAGSDLNADCDGAIAMQGHGQLTIGNGEGPFAVFQDIGKQIINYFQFVPGGTTEHLTIQAAGGDGLAASIWLQPNNNGAVTFTNSNGILAQFNDPAADSSTPHTSYFRFTAGMAGTSPVMTVVTGLSAETFRQHAPGNGGYVFENDNGRIMVITDGQLPSTSALSYLRLTTESASVPLTLGTSGLSGGTNHAFNLSSAGSGAVNIIDAFGTTAAFVDTIGAAHTSYFQFTPGSSGVSPIMSIAPAAGLTADTMRFVSLGNGGVTVENGNGRMLVLADGQALGVSMIAYPRFTTPSAANQVLGLSISAGTGTNIPWNISSLGTGEIAFLTGATKQMRILNVASAVNIVEMFGAVTGGSPVVRGSSGSNLLLGNNGGVATNATSGFIQIAACAGTPTGTPVNPTSVATMVYDSTANKLWVYSGAAWRGVVLT